MPKENSIEVSVLVLRPPFGMVKEQINMYAYHNNIQSNIKQALEILENLRNTPLFMRVMMYYRRI